MSATKVVIVNAATIAMEADSTNRYRPSTSRIAQLAPTTTANVLTGISLPPIFTAVATPPTMPATCGTKHTNIASQSQSTQETASRGPGNVFSASSVVSPRTIA